MSLFARERLARRLTMLFPYARLNPKPMGNGFSPLPFNRHDDKCHVTIQVFLDPFDQIRAGVRMHWACFLK
jgi:hypothetical protein